MKINIISLILLMFCNISCIKFVDHAYRIKILNNSPDTIQFFASYTYPDTTIIIKKPILITAFPLKYGFLDSKKEWNDVLPSGILSVFFLSKDTVDKYSWDIIRSENKIIKRTDITMDYLKTNNWTLTYP